MAQVGWLSRPSRGRQRPEASLPVHTIILFDQAFLFLMFYLSVVCEFGNN